MPTQRRKPPHQPPPGRPFLTPDASPFRHAVERRSAPVLLFLRGLPRLALVAAVVAFVAGGLIGEGALGAACLLVVAAFFGWLLFLSWPAVPAGARLMRIAVLAVMLAAVGFKFSA